MQKTKTSSLKHKYESIKCNFLNFLKIILNKLENKQIKFENVPKQITLTIRLLNDALTATQVQTTE